jgi:hypothetical protein
VKDSLMKEALFPQRLAPAQEFVGSPFNYLVSQSSENCA